jgi:PKD domain
VQAATSCASPGDERGKGTVATPDQIRRRGRWPLVLGALLAALALAAVAVADNTVADGDGVTPVADNNMSFGNVSCGVATNKTALVAISRQGNYATSNVFQKGSTVTVSVQSVTGAGLSAAMGTTTINIPDSWDTASNGTLTAAVSSIVTVSSSSPGPGSGSVVYRATGTKSDGTTPFTRDDSMSVSWTVLNNCVQPNQAPTADAGGPYSGAEGASISLDGTGSSDTDGSIASTTWTVTPHSGGANDPDAGASCSFVDGTSSSSAEPKVACTDDGVYDVALSVTDDDGASDGDSTTLTLANANPSATPSLPGGDVDEGDAFSLGLAGANDPGSNDALQYQFDCGDGGGYNAPSGTSSRTCPTSDNGSRSVKLKVLDDDGGAAEYAGTVTIVNVAPTADGLGATSPIHEGGSSSLSLTNPTDVSSVDKPSLRYSFACDGNDGSLAGSYATASTSNAASCHFADNGSFPVKGRVYDKDGGATTYDATVVVTNVAPTVAASFTAASVDCRTTATLTIDPDDAGVNDSPWKVNVDWGDGTSEPEITRTNLDSFTVTHVYALANTYNATVSVTDKDGDAGSDLTNGLTINQTYTVDFLPPFDDSTPSGLIANKMKNGRVVPVKATLYDDCVGAFVTDPATDVTIKVSKTVGGGTGDPVEEYADAGQSSAGTNAFRWSSDGFWIYNLDSKALGLSVGTNYRVDILVDGVKATVDTWAVLQPVK